MSSEQDQVPTAGEGSQLPVLAAPSEQAAPVSARTVADAPRRRIVVAAKPAEKPLAFISRDLELSEEFEEQLGRARNVVVFPSLTHFCTDSSRMVWGGVVVARACGWDERLLGFVPSTSCIAFWRVAEEGYGWPASVRRLDTQEEVRAWLEEIARPLAFQLPKQKRTREKTPRATRPRPSKPQLKFELATARGVVTESASASRERASSAPLQMELSGLAAGSASATRAGTKPASVRPAAARVSVGAAARPRSEAGAQRHRPTEVERSEARGSTPGSTASARGASKVSSSTARSTARLDSTRGSLPVELQRVSSASVLRMPSNLPAFNEKGFMKLAAELGLARATALLDELRARARSVR